MNNYFSKQMQELLGSKYKDFVAAYENKPRHKALRVNTLKISVNEFAELCGALLPNPLCAQSFYFGGKPSLDPYYHAGLYYMQEPSASAAVFALAPYIGERVLDLCAAPGGKSTQAAAFMRGGVLFCNDVEHKRVNALCENIARLGVNNAVVTCATAESYRAAGFDGYFDTLIVDAPCSGGGMMRYESVPYSDEIVKGCAARQKKILDDAAELLCRGGHMLYSTCTFSREENEDNVNHLLQKGFETVDVPLISGAERGIGLPHARRLYPHNFDGEGHFYCVLEKVEGVPRRDIPSERLKSKSLRVGGLTVETKTREQSDRAELINFDMPRVRGAKGFRVVSAGVAASSSGEPCHALSHALDTERIERVGRAELGELAAGYIRGAQLDTALSHGLKIATVGGYALGFAKSAPSGNGDTVLKNLYPKSLRIDK